MKFKKKSKAITSVTVIFTIILCVCFNALGAYAKPVENTRTAKEQVSVENGILYENGVYYIFTDGAAKKDKPNASFTNGTIGIVLVKKDGYISLGPFTNKDKLVEEVNTQCKAMVEKGIITKKDAEIIIKATDKIKRSTIQPTDTKSNKKEPTYTYTQSGYYQDSFLIEMGWNFNVKLNLKQTYTAQTKITLTDGKKITIFFADKAKKYVKDKKALASIGKLIDSLNKKNPYPTIEKPFIVSITPVPAKDIPALVEKYFKNDNVAKFSALFATLDKTAKKKYYQKIYQEDKIALFSTIVQDMGEDLILQYADRADQDDKIDFFTILIDYMRADDLKRYAEKYYKKNDIARFTILLGHMTKEEKQNWLNKAKRDKRNTLYIIIADEL